MNKTKEYKFIQRVDRVFIVKAKNLESATKKLLKTKNWEKFEIEEFQDSIVLDENGNIIA